MLEDEHMLEGVWSRELMGTLYPDLVVLDTPVEWACSDSGAELGPVQNNCQKKQGFDVVKDGFEPPLVPIPMIGDGNVPEQTVMDQPATQQEVVASRDVYFIRK